MNKGLVVFIATVLVLGGAYFYLASGETPVAEEVTTSIETEIKTTTETQTASEPVGMSVEVPVVSGTEVTVPATVVQVVVDGSNFKFVPNTISAKKGDKVRITFKNVGGSHNLRVEGYDVGTKVIASGTEETFEFTADKIGSFEYFCSVGSHRTFGMKGTLVVSN